MANRDRARKGKNQQKKERQRQKMVEDNMIAQFDAAQTVRRKQIPPLQAKNETQGQHIASILAKDITFVTGPAGTGKTYVSVALAAEALERGDIERIIVTRPMQECDEDMGFLPGSEGEKYAPWVEPVLDVLIERLGRGFVEYLIKSERIQCKPLMMMRGKDWKDAWVILDEGQNVTPKQMKMFLTRIGEGSKLIIDGDLKQTDLQDYRGEPKQSGLHDAEQRLKGIPQIGWVEYTPEDIVRHGLIRTILERYE